MQNWCKTISLQCIAHLHLFKTLELDLSQTLRTSFIRLPVSTLCLDFLKTHVHHRRIIFEDYLLMEMVNR